MKKLMIVWLGVFIVFSLDAQQVFVNEPVRMLALGDSYTIGQSVAYDERWPVQFLERLETIYGISDSRVDFIAQTGWTTQNLDYAIRTSPYKGGDYNLVSLLVGVNNQYQGVDIGTYDDDFLKLLNVALGFVNYEEERVVVLSIPDYAYTPLFEGSVTISDQIDDYNEINRAITTAANVTYVDVTGISRNGLEDPEFVASDGLHPSGKQYGRWVDAIMRYVEVVNFDVAPGNGGDDTGGDGGGDDDDGNDGVTAGSGNSVETAASFSFRVVNSRLWLDGHAEGTVVRIMDIMGRVVEVFHPDAGEHSFDISSLDSGVYILHVQAGGQTVSRGFILP